MTTTTAPAETPDRRLTVVPANSGRNATGDNRTSKPAVGKPAKTTAPTAAKKTPTPATAAKAATFAKVKMDLRIPVLAEWLSKQGKPLTSAEIAAAAPPSPMSVTVANYTLPDPRLHDAMKKLGFKLSLVDGKWMVTKVPARAARKTSAASDKVS